MSLEKRARELAVRILDKCSLSFELDDAEELIADALRAVERETLERATQAVIDSQQGVHGQTQSYLRALVAVRGLLKTHTEQRIIRAIESGEDSEVIDGMIYDARVLLTKERQGELWDRLSARDNEGQSQ